MRHMIRLLCLFSAWSLVCLTSSGAEEWPRDDVPIITLSGGVIAPASPQENIRMDSMEIKLRLKTGSYGVDAVFRLFNTGETTTEWIGFPKHGKLVMMYGVGRRVIRDFIRFEGWVNGRKELFEEKSPFLRGDRYPFPGPRLSGFMEETRWMAKKIVFPEKALTTVRIRCEVPYEDIRGNIPQDYGNFYLGPAQYWNGNIVNAEIVFENPEDPGFKRTRVHLLVAGTEVSKKTFTNALITYELRQSPVGNGRLCFSQLPKGSVHHFKERGNE